MADSLMNLKDDTADFRTDGHCLCKKIEYMIKAGGRSPLYHVACHCVNCRRHTGTSFVTNTILYKEDFAWREASEGTLKIYRDAETDSTKPLNRCFCSNCGSPVFATTPIWDEIVSIFAGTLVDQQSWRPTKEQYAECKAPWLPDLGIENSHPRGPMDNVKYFKT